MQRKVVNNSGTPQASLPMAEAKTYVGGLVTVVKCVKWTERLPAYHIYLTWPGTEVPPCTCPTEAMRDF